MPKNSKRSSKVSLFRAGAFEVAFAALLAVSTTMATARGLEAQQVGGRQARTISARLGYTPNTNLPEPAMSGRPATGAIFHVTLYTLTWIDAEGNPTRSPGYNRMVGMLSGGRLMVMGSMDERLGSVRRSAQQAAADESVRFFGTYVNSMELEQIRAILEERLGDFNQYSSQRPRAVRPLAGSETTYQGSHNSNDPYEKEREAQRRADKERERSKNDEAVREIRNMPAQIIRDGVRDATYQVEQTARNKINDKINKVINKLN